MSWSTRFDSLKLYEIFHFRLYLRELELPKNWYGDEIFKLRISKFWVGPFFSIETFKQIFEIPSLNNLFISVLNLCVSWIELKSTHLKNLGLNLNR